MQEIKTKNVLMANDLAGFGKVALSNAIPIMACANIETSILPTVILSSHTGGFKNIYIDDYTKGMRAFLKQWSDLPVKYDAIVTVYFKSEEQIDILLDFKNSKQAKDALLIVDPIMADNGKFYTGFDKKYAKKMLKLCENADYIIPNLTEAKILTNCNEINTITSKANFSEIIQKLKDLGAKNIIVTGVSFDNENLCVAYSSLNDNQIEYIYTKKLDCKFIGTGDLFTAIVSTCLVKNIKVSKAIKFAIEWLEKCLHHTISLNRDLKYGVCFEPYLSEFINNINELEKER